MAFLDNSGDILLDAVLTDTGRFRMARGDFKITKFALGDDEIDYSLFNRSHPSGSAYYDLEVLKTPILEAFTNNTSLMKSKLMTITRTNALHLPVLKLHNGGYKGQSENHGGPQTNTNGTLGTYVVTVDTNTEHRSNSLVTSTTINGKGVILAAGRLGGGISQNFIRIESGLDTTQVSPAIDLPVDLQENQFIVEMDDRLGHLVDIDGAQVPVSFIDDDQIASYYLSANAGAGANLIVPPLDGIRGDGGDTSEGLPTAHRIRGPRGKMLQFKIKPNINLTTSTYLFEKLGSSVTQTADDAPMKGFRSGKTYLYVDTYIRVTAATTGTSIDVPVRYLKKSGTS